MPAAVVTELDHGGEREKTGLGWSFIGGMGYGVEGRGHGPAILVACLA